MSNRTFISDILHSFILRLLNIFSATFMESSIFLNSYSFLLEASFFIFPIYYFSYLSAFWLIWVTLVVWYFLIAFKKLLIRSSYIACGSISMSSSILINQLNQFWWHIIHCKELIWYLEANVDRLTPNERPKCSCKQLTHPHSSLSHHQSKSQIPDFSSIDQCFFQYSSKLKNTYHRIWGRPNQWHHQFPPFESNLWIFFCILEEFPWWPFCPFKESLVRTFVPNIHDGL